MLNTSALLLPVICLEVHAFFPRALRFVVIPLPTNHHRRASHAISNPRLKDLGVSGSPAVPRRAFRDSTASPLDWSGPWAAWQVGTFRAINTDNSQALYESFTQVLLPKSLIILYVKCTNNMERKEYIFKEVDGVSIDADVYFRRDQSSASPIGQFTPGKIFQYLKQES